MKKLRWQLIIIFLTGIVVGILLLGEQPAAKVEPFSTPEPEAGGIYTEALIGSPQRLDPLFDTSNAVDRDVDRLVFSGLIRFDARGLPQPDLAETWGISQDGTLYNFKLRQKVTWHDGQPFTADDVLFTIDLMRSGGEFVPEDLQQFWKDVDVQGKGDSLQFKLPEPFAPFLDYLSFGVLPKHLLGALPIDQIVNSPFNMQPVGTGPFRFDRLLIENGQVNGVVLAAFSGYYQKAPFLEQIVFRYYPDSESALKAYQDGQVQGINEITPDILQRALAEPNLGVYSGRKPELTMLLFNLKSQEVPFFEEAEVRRALMSGLNRQAMIDKVLNGQAILANGPIFPGTWAYFDGLKSTEFDPDKARTALIEAGYVLPENETVRTKDKVALKFTLLYPDTEKHRAVAEWVQRNWKDLNVEVNLEAVPYDQLISDRLQERAFQAALVDFNYTRTPDPDPYPFWDSVQAANGQNYTQWNNKIASEYLEQARVTTDLNERARLYRNFQVIFADDLPALPLFYPVYNYGVDRQVQGVRMGPLMDSSDRFVSVAEWFLNARTAASAKTPAPGQ